MNPRLSAARSHELEGIELMQDQAREGYPIEEGGAQETSTTEDGAREPLPPPGTGGRALAYARLLWSHRALLGKALLAGLVAGAVIAWLLPAQYESTAQLMPPESQSNSGMAMLATLAAKTGNGVGALAGDALGLKSSGSLFIGILHSRTVEDRLVSRFGLKNIYRTQRDEDARRELAENTGASEDRKSGIITLTVTDHDRERARALATAYVEELNRLVAELSTSAAHRERVFLEERLAANKTDLDQASRELSEFSSQNATIDLKDQGRAMVEAVATLQAQLTAAESERQALAAVYTRNNVRVRSAEARVVELRNQMRKLGGAPETGEAEAKVIEAKQKEDGTPMRGKEEGQGGPDGGRAARSDLVYPSLRRLPLLGMRYEDLYRRAKVQEMVYETLTQQYEIARVQEAKETPSVKMLDEASLPERRSFPPRTLIALCGALAGFVGASVCIVARQGWQRVAASNPKKQFAEEVFQGVNSRMPWATPNGSRWQAAAHRVWVRLLNGNKTNGNRMAREASHGGKSQPARNACDGSAHGPAMNNEAS